MAEELFFGRFLIDLPEDHGYLRFSWAQYRMRWSGPAGLGQPSYDHWPWMSLRLASPTDCLYVESYWDDVDECDEHWAWECEQWQIRRDREDTLLVLTCLKGPDLVDH